MRWPSRVMRRPVLLIFERSGDSVTHAPRCSLQEDRITFWMTKSLNRLSILNVSVATGPYCESVRLEPFDLAQMSLALRSYPPTVGSEITELARTNTKFRELASRGSLLYAMGELWMRPGGLSQYRENINSAAVVGTFVRSTYDRQARKSEDFQYGGPSRRRIMDFMVLNTSERQFFMQAVACSMAIEGLPNQISSEELRRVVAEFYAVIPEAVSSKASPALRETTVALRARMQGVEDDIESIVTDVRGCGLLVTDLAKPGFLRFAHKSFMEYLFAEVVALEYADRHSDLADASIEAGLRVLTSNSRYGERGWFPTKVLTRMPETLSFFSEVIAIRVSAIAKRERAIRMIIFGRRHEIVEMLSVWSDLPFCYLLIFGGRRSFDIVLAAHPNARLYLMYSACCNAAGETVGRFVFPTARILLRGARRWIESNLPHLTEGKSSTATRVGA
jgi:hypothetical protein